MAGTLSSLRDRVPRALKPMAGPFSHRIATAVAAVALVLAVSSPPALAGPGFKLPFICGATYVGSTYAGHGWAVDFNQPYNRDAGDPVVASAAGTVTQTKYATSNGQITITHAGGWKTVYAHMSRISVRLYQTVARGRLLGFVDDVGYATTDHLHYEQRYNGVRVRPRFDGVLYRYWTSIKSTNCSDTAPPAITAPNPGFVPGTSVKTSGASVPIRNAWTVSDALSGVKYSVLERRTDDGLFSLVFRSTPPASPSFTSYFTPSATAVTTHRVRATDNTGNWSSYATGPAFKLRVIEDDAAEVVTYAGTGWGAATDATNYSGGTAQRASAADNSVTLAETGHDFAIVATKGPDRGRLQIYLDGVAGTVVDLYAATTAHRQIVAQVSYSAPAPHTLEVRVLGDKNGASSSSIVEVDAFLVLQP